MRARNIGSCPKCMKRQPFADNDTKIEKGIEYQFECRGCGRLVDVYDGPNNTIVSESKDKQRKLFE